MDSLNRFCQEISGYICKGLTAQHRVRHYLVPLLPGKDCFMEQEIHRTILFPQGTIGSR